MAHTEKCRGCHKENSCDYIDCQIEKEKVIRNKAIDEFVEKAWEVLGSEDRDIYTRESIIEIAEQMKKEI